MRLDYLKTFLTVARIGSFSLAAKELHTSQGTVSNHIATLEEYFDAQLLKRTIKGVEVTESGAILQEAAEKILYTVENAKAQISSTKHKLTGVIKIAASTIPEEHLLPSLIVEFQKNNSIVRFKTKTEDSVTSLLSLLANDVDFAATGSIRGYDERFEAIEIGREELVLVVPRGHELASRKSVSLQEILKYPYINREETSGTRAEIERVLEVSGIPASKLKTPLELGSTESVITAVSEGIGISIVSSIASKKAQAAGLVAILKLEGADSTRKLYLLRPKRNLLKAAEVFWEFCKEQASKKA
ncbi:MAG: selenium metabolism-associated LysR family transcriptional regulator [Candidatus Bathyarchaeota archaeon]|nr:selenium metabolism-associated LysR family transcriptional regulator [Candidatus Bathyarchaeota archaeon]